MESVQFIGSGATQQKLEGLFIKATLITYAPDRLYLQIPSKKRLQEFLRCSSEKEALEAFARMDAERGERKATQARLKAKAHAERKAYVEKWKAELKPGMLLNGSWGYEQTNLELWEVVEVRGTKVILKPVAKEIVSSSGPMSGTYRAIQGGYVGDERIERRITAYGVKYSDHCGLKPASWDGHFHASWYA